MVNENFDNTADTSTNSEGAALESTENQVAEEQAFLTPSAGIQAPDAASDGLGEQDAPQRADAEGASSSDAEPVAPEGVAADDESAAHDAAGDVADAPQPEAETAGEQSATNAAEPAKTAGSTASGIFAAYSTAPTTALFFQAPDVKPLPARDYRDDVIDDDDDEDDEPSTVRRRARRRSGDERRSGQNDPANTVVKVRQPREQPREVEQITEPQRIKGSTRLEAKKQRRRDGRDAGRRRPVVTEAEFLARRESVDRTMIVRSKSNKIQIGVLEDGVLVEHYVARNEEASLIGNVYLGRVQNVLPSMEAAFVDIGRGRNAVLYSGEVDWDAAETGNQPRRIELALKPGDRVLVQVTKDPVGHKGARLTSQVSLPGRYLVYVPNGSMNGISRKLPDTERARLKKILKEVLPDNVGVIVRTAAEGATEEQLTLDVNRLINQWAEISRQMESVQAPALLHSEPDLLIKIVRDVFNEDFQKMLIAGDDAQEVIESYLRGVAPDLLERVERYEGNRDVFDEYRITEQIEKALDRKVWLPSGGSLVIDRTEAMTVVDVNTGKFVGSGGNLEETVTKNNLESAEEIVRQLRLRDIGGIIVVDFIDMVLESNRDLVLRRLIECLSRDRTKHQVAEVTSLGLVQMTRKKLGLGLLESFSEPCEVCAGRGVIVHHDPIVKHRQTPQPETKRRGKGGTSNSNGNGNGNGGNTNGNGGGNNAGQAPKAPTHAITDDAKNALAKIAASTIVVHADDAQSTDQVTEQPAASERRNESRSERRNERRKNQKSQNRGAGSAQGNSGGGSAGQAEEAAPDSRAESSAPASRPETSKPDTSRPAPEPQVADSRTDARDALSILDIPLEPARKAKRVDPRDAEDLLGSVLDALPEPKLPGTGRARRRRVTTAGLTGTPVAHDADAGTSAPAAD
ncbi:Rne/Rng family ribonuclease [Mycetocola zhujimingii]|uniref:Rne/Rng family ribonuclease n=1 Tax=Mycetocola zhujimingii TaxID=2079792 RepID=UPI000D3814CA|nr:Rne/Rng family ribonuclease [Mycetocola zhujimingii]AWB86651.1 ribonuclease E/G [Mycetocola zhujimingii]